MHETLLVTAGDVRAALDMRACIDAIEDAFRRLATGDVIPPGMLGAHVPDGGFHMKTAGLRRDRSYFVAKVNANFPSNPSRHGLPTVQGVAALFDAERGELLALIDSMELTGIRTAAASAVAARHLARADAATLTIVGCGVQGLHHARAMAAVRALSRIQLVDRDRARADALASQLRTELSADIAVIDDLREAAREADILVTCTTSRQPLLGPGELPASGFVAAVGADSDTKQELHPEALAASAVVVDILEQCAQIGELHHALDAGVMTLADVRASLADVVSGRAAGRFGDETIVFDSTGTALQDVAAAALVYERLHGDSGHPRIALGGGP